jgi:hypothetical protein
MFTENVKFRGVLGLLKDNPTKLETAAKYIRNYEGEKNEVSR